MPELLERFDVAADRAPIDTRWSAISLPVDERPGLEQLEQLEQSRGRCDHARSRAVIEGDIRPILKAMVDTDPHDAEEDGMSEYGDDRLDGEGLRLLDGKLARPQPAAARAARRLGRMGGVRGDERRPADPGRHGERGRVPHRPRRRLRRDVLPLLRPGEPSWSIYWADSRRCGVLDPPVFGGFDGDIGIFEGDDTFEGRPIVVRFTWSRVDDPDAAVGAGLLRRRRPDLGDELGEDFTPVGGALSALYGAPAVRAGYRHVTKLARPAPACAARSGRSSSGTTSRRPTRPSRTPIARARPRRARGGVGGRGARARRRARLRDPPPLRGGLLLPAALHVAQRQRDLGDGLGEERRRGRRLPPVAASQGAHRPTFCVWELGVVWHEQRAWSRFLRSERNGEDEQAYLEDSYHGVV